MRDVELYVRSAGGDVVPFDDDFDVLVIGDQKGFPFLETTGTVLSNLFRIVDRGKVPASYSQPQT